MTSPNSSPPGGVSVSRPLTAFDLKIYGRAGIAADAAMQWALAGINPYDAEAFRAAGANLSDAAEWHLRGVSGSRLATWRRAGIDPAGAVAAEQESTREVKPAGPEKRRSRRTYEQGTEIAQQREAAARSLRITVGDIAELAGKPPSVVSHWRKGNRNFPEPVAGGRSPHFLAGDVLPWLREHVGVGDPDDTWYWRHAVEQLPERTPEGRSHLRAFVAALVTLAGAAHGLLPTGEKPLTRPVSARHGSLGELRKLAGRIENAEPELRGVLQAPLGLASPDADAVGFLVLSLDAALLDADDRSALLRLVDIALDTLTALSPDAPVTHPLLADLIAELARPLAGEAVLDPACGEGELLMRLADRTGPAAPVSGVDIDADALAVAQIRLYLRHNPYVLHCASALAGSVLGDARYDVIVADPPFTGAASQPALWLDLAASRLKPDGRAFVSTPLRSLRPNGPLARPLQRGEVSAVALVPSSLRWGAREPVAVCVLTGHAKRNDHVLIVDAANEVAPALRAVNSMAVPLNERRSTFSPRPIADMIQRWHAGDASDIGTADVPSAIRPAVDVATNGVRRLAPPGDNLAEATTLARRTAQELRTVLANDPGNAAVARLLAALEDFTGAR